MPNYKTAGEFWSAVCVGHGGSCWIWLGKVGPGGYGVVRFRGSEQRAHRVAYTLVNGPIPDGLVLDHVLARGCTSRLCVNPDHLEAVTIRENILRAPIGPLSKHPGKTVCLRGHVYADVGVLRNASGCRTCRACYLERNALRAAERRAVTASRPRPKRPVMEVCKRGHVYSQVGFYVQVRNGRDMRNCKACQRLRNSASYA